ncbi:MAG: peptidoglycan-binding protein [Acidobacteriia bacterium]|nr:peptidoglycan-binding protein [Terriglobia bacterium]
MTASPRRIRTFLALLTSAALAWSVSVRAATSKLTKSAPGKSTAQKKSATRASASKSSGKKTTRRVSARGRRHRKESFRTRLARQKLQPERIEEIQRGLFQAGYLNAEPNGKWDDSTRQAMRSFQQGHGFPATGLPEAKSLMKLGLGPHPLPEELDPTAQASANPQPISTPGESSSTSDRPAR